MVMNHLRFPRKQTESIYPYSFLFWNNKIMGSNVFCGREYVSSLQGISPEYVCINIYVHRKGVVSCSLDDPMKLQCSKELP